MKKILLLLPFLLSSMVSFSQPPPPPAPGKNTDGKGVSGYRVAAPIGNGLAILVLCAGGYAILRKRNNLLETDE